VDAGVVWLVVAVILAGLEVASPGFLLLMFAGGALAASIASAVGVGTVGASAVFALVSVALLAFVRPVARRHLYQAPLERSGTAALIGTQAVVVEAVDGSGGRVKLAGEIWSARAFDEDARFEPGAKVSVFQIDGATAVVG
jgi:membrane protein implicated in regulation of membrane protease activity